MSGEWLIRQHDRDGRYTQERITVEDIPIDSDYYLGSAILTEPFVQESDHALRFVYRDNHILVFPWHNILRAEYRPHTEP